VSGPPPDDSRAAEIGRSYDAVPYDPAGDPALAPDRLRGALAASGFAVSDTAAPDVLDIGCGTGAQMEYAARHGAGRLVGIDASAVAVGLAQARGAAFGARWRILHGDAAAIGAERLGPFDIVQVLGTLYIMPPAARAAALALAAACLKPGGVLVLNHYTGAIGLLRARLGRLLHAANDPAWPPEQQIATMRANVAALISTTPAQGLARDLTLAILNSMAASGDTVMFHEALGPVYDALHTGDVAAALAPKGVELVNMLPPIALQPGAPSQLRARAADAWDFTSGGGYRTVLYTRPLPGAPPQPGLRHPALRWSSAMVPAARNGRMGFEIPGLARIEPTPGGPLAAVQALVAGPRRWAELRALAGPHGDAQADIVVDDLLGTIWHNRLGHPHWAP
jgi:SAM-dependent methyltransferase